VHLATAARGLQTETAAELGDVVATKGGTLDGNTNTMLSTLKPKEAEDADKGVHAGSGHRHVYSVSPAVARACARPVLAREGA